MQFIPTELPGVVLIEAKAFEDERGYFMETFHRPKFAAAGMDVEFLQDNHSFSRHGVLRGLHYQITQPQGKLVRVVRGSVFDVAVDVRRSSPTFGRWVGYDLTDSNRRQLYIPPGFAHGFCVTSDAAEWSTNAPTSTSRRPSEPLSGTIRRSAFSGQLPARSYRPKTPPEFRCRKPSVCMMVCRSRESESDGEFPHISTSPSPPRGRGVGGEGAAASAVQFN